MSQKLGITVDKNQNISEWYTQVVQKAELADYAPVEGCMVIRPYGMKLWESIKDQFDDKIKETGVENAYFPLLIPESYLEKESEIVDGFDPEVAWVTEGGDSELEEKVAVRPTSESIIAPFMSKWIRSHRDLPLRLNQWANVVRWEATDTRPFLRTREFLWQEGHTAHETEAEADEETMLRLNQYQEILEDHLAIPTVTGYKPEHDKFPGAKYTTTVETMMPDGKSIQSATSHQLGQKFSRSFDITFEDENEETNHAFTTSWGLSTRTIGALIMAHGDNQGLRLPPSVAPIQIVIVPIYNSENKEEILEYSNKIREKCEDQTFSEENPRVKLDERDHKNPGFKFNEWELKGVPLRIEVGPDEMENETLTLVRRDNSEKINIETGEIEKTTDILSTIQNHLYTELEEYLEDHIHQADSKEEILKQIGSNRGYVKTKWCGREKCESEVKEEISAEIVVLPFREDSKPSSLISKNEEVDGKCSVCGEEAQTWAYFAKNY